MTDHFTKLVKKRERPDRRPRELATGRLQARGALDSPEFRGEVVRWVRAIDDLLPLFAILAGDEQELANQQVGKIFGVVLTSLRQAYVAELAAVDPEAARQATKPRVLSGFEKFILLPAASREAKRGGRR